MQANRSPKSRAVGRLLKRRHAVTLPYASNSAAGRRTVNAEVGTMIVRYRIWRMMHRPIISSCADESIA
jgi:hypothetical protein